MTDPTDLDDRIRHAVSRIAASAPEPPPLPNLPPERARRGRVRRVPRSTMVATGFVLIVLVAGIVAIARQGSGRQVKVRLGNVPPSAPATPVDPVAAFNHLREDFPIPNVTSGVVTTAQGDYAAVSYNLAVAGQGTHPIVMVFAFDGAAWAKVATITLDLGGVVDPGYGIATPITVVHVTGTVTPDFAVVVNYNSGNAGAIISDIGGTWHPLTFTGGPGAVRGGDEIDSPVFTGTAVTETYNDCTPDCAGGTNETITYRYSPATGQMEAIS